MQYSKKHMILIKNYNFIFFFKFFALLIKQINDARGKR